MVSAVKWEAAPSGTGVLGTEINSLANNTITAAGTEVNNASDLNTVFWLELEVTFGSSPTDAVPTADIYMVRAPDGTNYDTSPPTSGTDFGETYLCSIPLQKTTGAQRKTVGPFLLPPMKVKFLLDNQSGVSYPASGTTLTLYPANYESQ